jgi:phosphoglycerol transferase
LFETGAARLETAGPPFGIACPTPHPHTPATVAKAPKSPPARKSSRKPVKAAKAAQTPRSARAAELPGLDLLRYAALAVIVIGVWCSIYGRWSAAAWNVPIEYGIDANRSDVLSNFAGFKAAEDGTFWPIIFHNVPQLGAPYAANWNDYPVTEDFLIWGTGVLGKIIGLFAASNFLIMLLQVLAALAFYYAARRMKCDWRWSFVGALLFGLAPYGFAHSLHHFVITAYWHMALGLLVCYWVSNGNGLKIGSRDYWIAIGIAVITGWQNVYYTSMFVQMVGIGLIIQWVRHGWRAAIPAFSIGCAAFAAFMVMNLDTIGFALLHGANPSAATRVYRWLEYYGFKLVDCFVPFPNHKIPTLANIGRTFYSSTILPAEDPPACYFGIVGIAAFLWMAVVTVRNAIGSERKKIPLEAVLTLWIFFYATVGGINGIIGVVGFQMFRSTTRYCIVLLCIALMFAVRRLSLLSKRWPTPLPLLVPALVGVIGVWEFLPPTAGEDIGIISQWVNSDRTFAQEMERELPKGGMVFQLPVMDFPESPIPGVFPYEHFRPYLYTKDLRYSFGSDKGRVQDAWQRVIVGMPAAEQIATLESYGFSGIYINTAGYSDRGEGLLNQYKQAGRDVVIASPLKDLYCVVLHPSPNPLLPPPGPLFSKGWYAEQDGASGERDRLASGNAELILTNPGSQPADMYANFYIATVGARTVTLQGAGVYESWHVDQQNPVKVPDLHLTLAPGPNRLTFTTDAPPTQQAIGPITFDIVNFNLSDSPAQ